MKVFPRLVQNVYYYNMKTLTDFSTLNQIMYRGFLYLLKYGVDFDFGCCN